MILAQPLEAIEAEQARRSLRRFVEHAWPCVEPDTPFVPNWHIDLLCQALQNVTAGEIQRLLINVPPGCMKSLIVSVFWPAWEWATNPSLRYLVASYGSHLTIRDNLRVRSVIRSDWYQRYFAVTFSSDQNAKERFDTTAGGWRIATSVGGVGTGEHPDRIIIDDPHTADQARSDQERQTALDWFDRTISSRGVARNARRVVIMQRLHEQDLSGHLLDLGGWTHICWPMRFDPQVASADDRRTTAGDLLWPALFSQDKLRPLELELGPYGVAGQMQQRPAPEGGGLFRCEWFDYVDAPPVDCQYVRGWDTAATENGGDFTAGVKLGYSPSSKLFYVADVKRGQWSPKTVDAEILLTAQADGRNCRQREEEERGASGKAVIGNRLFMLRGYDYAGVSISGDKVTRARPFRSQCEGRNVKLVRGPWNAPYLQELSVFPAGAHDDQVDASSCAFNDLVVHQPKDVVASVGAKPARDASWQRNYFRR